MKTAPARVVQDEQLRCLDLNLAGGHFRVDCVSIAQPDLAHGSDNVFGPDVFALGVPLRRDLLVEDDLADTAAVAQVEKDEIAVVAAAVDPAHQDNLLASVGGAQFAAMMRPFERS